MILHTSLPYRSRPRAVGLLGTLLLLSPLALGAQSAPATTPLDDFLVNLATKPGLLPKTPDLLFVEIARNTRGLSADELLVSAAVAVRDQSAPRTDQQTGAGSNTPGSATIAEKPGISDFVNFAIEQGAITKTSNGTSFTLQTTPYLFYTRFGSAAIDTAATWDRSVFLRNLGLSATFNTDSSTSSGLNNFSGAQAKYIFIGNRSSRDLAFRNHIRDLVGKEMNAALAANGAAEKAWVDGLTGPELAAFDQAVIEFNNWQKAETNKGPISADVVRRKLTDVVNGLLHQLSPQAIAAVPAVVTSIMSEQATRSTAMKRIADEAKSWIQQGAELSLAYGYERDPTIADYSDLKLLFAYQSVLPLTANVNFDLALNNRRTSAAGVRLKTIRSYSGEGSLTLGRFAGNLLDFSFNAKIDRLQMASRTTTAVQAKSNIYLLKGVTIPLSITYSNGTDEVKKSQVRFNASLSFSGDAFMGVARAR
jgi:hypothetical protein